MVLKLKHREERISPSLLDAAPAAVAHVLELNLDAVGRVEQDLGRTVTRRRRPELVALGQIRVQDRTNLRRARGVE